MRWPWLLARAGAALSCALVVLPGFADSGNEPPPETTTTLVVDQAPTPIPVIHIHIGADGGDDSDGPPTVGPTAPAGPVVPSADSNAPPPVLLPPAQSPGSRDGAGSPSGGFDSRGGDTIEGDDNLTPEDRMAPPQGGTQGPTSATAQGTGGDLWDRVRQNFGLVPLRDDRLVYKQIAWFVERPDYVERTLERSRPYLFFIVDEVQRRGMPSEIALLPFVESAYNPHALSRNQASGIWQFIPSTGRLFGLRQDWWYDGRKDVVAATYSALDYLQRLHDEFGSWELALAGYNCGEGKIRREIAYNSARNRPTDYESLNLPDETRNYIPELLAAKAIILEPEHYGLILPPIPDQPYFEAVTTRQRIDTKRAAEFAGLSEEDFLMLNPGFNRPVIGFSFNQEKTILVPIGMADSFLKHLEDPNATLLTWKTHQLKRGESLDKVAHQYGLSGEELKRVNGISNSKTVAGGGVVLVPGHESTDPQKLDTSARPESEIPAPGTPKHPGHQRKGHSRKAETGTAPHHGHRHHAHPAGPSKGHHSGSGKSTRSHSKHHSTHHPKKKP